MGPVLVTRRDGENMVLMTETDLKDRTELLNLAGHIMTAVAGAFEDGSLIKRMNESFAWMHVLKPEAQEECVQSLIKNTRAAFALDTPSVALINFESWKETAYAVAHGLLDEEVEWLDEVEVVEEPLAVG